MKLSHVIVAIVFFLLGAAAVMTYQLYQRTGAEIAAKLPRVEQPKAEPAATAATPKMSFRIEQNVNRHGSDYRDFAMAAGEPFEVCQKACEAEAKCLAFTYVKAGIQGTTPHCWLKNTVPQAYPDDTCVSGVRT